MHRCVPRTVGVLHNTWYDRDRDVHVDLLDYHQMIRAREHLAPGVETIHEALKRHEPEAFTATTYEYGDRGADYSTYAQMTTNGPIPTSPTPTAVCTAPRTSWG